MIMLPKIIVRFIVSINFIIFKKLYGFAYFIKIK